MTRIRTICAFYFVAVASLFMVMVTSGCGDEAYTGDTVQQALQKLNGSEKYHTELDLRLNLDGDLEKVDPDFAAIAPLELGLMGKMDFDRSKADEVRVRVYDIDFDGLTDVMRDISAASGESEVEAAMAAGMIQQMLGGLEFIMLGDTYYYKFAGTWFEMSMDDLYSSLPEEGGPDMDCMMQYYQDIYSSDAMMNYYLGGATELIDKEELSEGEIDGVKTRHFKGRLDSEQLVDDFGEILDKSFNALRECGMEEEIGRMKEEMGGDMQSMKDLLASIYENTNVELWIDEDNNVRQMKMDMDIDIAEIAAIFGDEHDVADVESITMNMVMTMKYSAFGEDIDIEAPEDALPFEDLMDSLGGGFGGIPTDSMTT